MIPGDKTSNSESNTFIDFEILKTEHSCRPANNCASLMLWGQVHSYLHLFDWTTTIQYCFKEAIPADLLAKNDFSSSVLLTIA